MFTLRQIDLITYLVNQENFIGGEQLSEHFNLSRKTIHTEIAAISEELGAEGRIAVTPKGYRMEFLSDAMRRRIYNEIKVYGGKSSLGVRPSSFVLYLLFLKGYVSMQSLADSFYLSKTAVALEILTLKRWVERYNGMELEISNLHGIKIHADEKRKRVYCANFGTPYAFRSMPFDKELSETYEQYLVTVQRILQESLSADGFLITGEEYWKNSRFLAISILRSRLGYDRGTDGTKGEGRCPALIGRLTDRIREAMGYQLTEAEQYDLWEMLRESSTLEEPEQEDSYLEAEAELILTKLENRISEIVGDIPPEGIFRDRSEVRRHLCKWALRAEAGDVSVNHYNESIVLRYPLEAHLNYRLIPEITGRPVTKETSFMALFLGASLNEVCNRVSVLLISNQNQSIVSQIKSAVYLCGKPKISSFKVLPAYAFEIQQEIKKQYDILLATDQETVLMDSAFYQVPCILSHNDLEELDRYIKHQAGRLYAEKRKRILETFVKRIQVTGEQADVDSIIGYPKDSYQSYHTLANKKIYICRIAPGEEPEICIYDLEKPVYYLLKKIQKIIFVRFPQAGEGIFDFFAAVREKIAED